MDAPDDDGSGMCDVRMITVRRENQKFGRIWSGCRISVPVNLGLLLVVLGCVSRTAETFSAVRTGRGAPHPPPGRAQVRVSLEPPPISERYPVLHGGEFTGASIPESPDPLAGYRWKEARASDELQIYVADLRLATSGYECHASSFITRT